MRATDTPTDPRLVILVFVVAGAGFSLFAAGCGGGASPGVASVASSTTATTATTQSGLGFVAFSRCMRSHGVPNFPDPQRLREGNPKVNISQAMASSPRARTAMSACSHLLQLSGPSGSQEAARPTRTQLADAVSFARCMRSHGVTRFPDPNAQGDQSVEMAQAQGIDVHSPAFLRVVQACIPASHGALTLAEVREAIIHVHG